MRKPLKQSQMQGQGALRLDYNPRYRHNGGNPAGCKRSEAASEQKKSRVLMKAAVKRGIKISGGVLFGIYVVGLIYFLFFAEGFGRGGGELYGSYNLQPFQEILRCLRYWDILGAEYVILNLAGNVIGFMPFGMLLPVFARSVRRGWKVGILSFEISAVVEISQLIFRVGSFDVDDMILNTLGGLLGYFLFYTVIQGVRIFRSDW